MLLLMQPRIVLPHSNFFWASHWEKQNKTKQNKTKQKNSSTQSKQAFSDTFLILKYWCVFVNVVVHILLTEPAQSLPYIRCV